jgi:acylphosphatase
MICKRVYYEGRVQGVGFRYTAQELAEGAAVAGHVRNLPNGSVELVVQGEPASVDAYLSALAARMASYIERSTVREEPPGNYTDFRIRH